MRVAQVCPRYRPYIGGIETHVERVSEALVERGFEVDVLTTDSSGKLPKEETINSVGIKRFKSWAPNEAYYFSRDLKKHLMKNSDSFDIVHAHGYGAFPALYATQAKGRNKLVFTPHYHGTGHTLFRSLLHIPYKFLGKRIFEKSDKTICVSNYEKFLIENHFGPNEEKVVVIPNGVNLEEFKVVRKKKKDHRAILYVGRLEKYKGVQYILQVLPRLSTDIVLEVVGKGPYKRSLVKLARELDVEGRVRFFEGLPRTELLQKYAEADVFVLLSKHEAFGISVAEALAAKKTCILANTSGLKEWIDNENCFGVNYPLELEGLVRLINRVIGREAQQTKLWNWEEAVGKLTELYKDVVYLGA